MNIVEYNSNAWDHLVKNKILLSLVANLTTIGYAFKINKLRLPLLDNNLHYKLQKTIKIVVSNKNNLSINIFYNLVICNTLALLSSQGASFIIWGSFCVNFHALFKNSSSEGTVGVVILITNLLKSLLLLHVPV